MTYQGKMDPECVALCDAINMLPGLTTHDSCSGHNEHPYCIWFCATALERLPRLVYWFSVCHCGFAGWSVVVKTDCAMSPVTFGIEGPVGPAAYEQAEAIAEKVKQEAMEASQ